MPVVYYNDNRPDRRVKNLGWLLKRAQEVQSVTVTHRENGEAIFSAQLFDKEFVCLFASQKVCFDWLQRHRALHRGARIVFNNI